MLVCLKYIAISINRGYFIDVEVHGEVRAPIFDKDGNEDYHYVNKNNDADYSYSEVRNLVKDDAELYALIKNRRIYIGDDNWVEVFLRVADGKDTGSIFDVLGDDVLDAFKIENIEWYKKIVDDFIKENC